MTKAKNQLIIVGGANGSGKTTFANAFLEDKDYTFLNADEIAKSLSPTQMDKYKVTAGKLFFERFQNIIEKKDNVLIESTLSGKYLLKYLPKLSEHYEISMFYVFINNIKVCIERIKERVKKGGHHVPTEDVIRRFDRSLYNFWHLYKNKVHKWYVYSNISDEYEEIMYGTSKEQFIVNDNIFCIFENRLNSLHE
jgi:predicted ABC-type ATPase